MPVPEDLLWQVPYWIRNDPQLMDLWEFGVAEYGPEDAEDFVRSTDYYDSVFAGIRRDDGSLRMGEDEYLATIDSYRQSLGAVRVNSDIFADQFVTLIEGEVSGREFWEERVSPVYDRVIDRGDEMLERYSQDWGLALTREALIASLLDPDMVGSKILNRQLGISEITYEIEMAHGDQAVDRYRDLATTLYEDGRRLSEVQDLMTDSRRSLPVLSVLARRHADPDDEFDLEEFTQATLWNDPQEARRMRRLMAQERSQFSHTGLGFERSRSGGFTGLARL